MQFFSFFFIKTFFLPFFLPDNEKNKLYLHIRWAYYQLILKHYPYIFWRTNEGMKSYHQKKSETNDMPPLCQRYKKALPPFVEL